MTAPFLSIERAVKEVVEAGYAPAAGRTGGDPGYTAGDPLFVWISLVTGSTTVLDGRWTIDIDVLAPTYGEAMDHCLAIEALLVDSRHRSSAMILDRCMQDIAPTERPWDDELTARVGGTYSFSARRSG